MIHTSNSPVTSEIISGMETPVYRIEVLVIDLDRQGPDDSIALIEQCKYLYGSCIRIEVKDAGKWHDGHPLNQRATDKSAYYDALPDPQQ